MRELMQGFDVRRLALTAGVALAAAGLLCVPAMSLAAFPRNLLGSLSFALAIALALTVSGNLRQSLVPPALLNAGAVLVAALVVTLVLFARLAPSPLAQIASPTGQHRIGSVMALGLVIGVAMAFVIALRERQAADQARHAARERLLEAQLMAGRLKLLQAQVEPHFLFNTLASVQRLVAIDPSAAGAMLEDLNQYLRASLPDMRESHSTLGRELDMARAYLNIMRVRMGARLSFEVEAPEALRGEPFPPTLLLSLVENAVEHGVGDRPRGHVVVSVRAEPICLAVRVADDGPGIDPHAAPGVGLTNLRERLQALHGGAASLTLEQPAQTPGLSATIRLPHVLLAASARS